MDLVVYSQTYRTRSPERQLEIDACLRRNLNHPGISRMVLFCESDTPPVPHGTVPVEVVSSDERVTYAEWFRWLKRQGYGISMLLNALSSLYKSLDCLRLALIYPSASWYSPALSVAQPASMTTGFKFGWIRVPMQKPTPRNPTQAAR